MAVFRKVLDNVADIGIFGLRFPFRHVAKLVGLRRMTVTVPGGRRMRIRTDQSDGMTLRQVFRFREYELGVPEIVQRVENRYNAILASSKQPVIIDAGANIGGATLWFADSFPRAHVVAIEPDPENAAVTRSNIAALSNASLLEAAIGGEEGRFALVDMGLASAQRTERASEGLPIVTVERALSTVENGELFIVKIDIEGFEADLFASNLAWLDKAFMVIIEPHDWMLPGRHSSRTFQRAMAAHAFEVLISGENLVYVRV